jgi:very-short-patch-repair endonuclease
MLTDGDRRLAGYAATHDGVFTSTDAARCGLSAKQIRERVELDWIACHRGVFRIAGVPETWRSRLRAATAASTPHGVVSHRSAAALYDLPGGRTHLTEITCPRWLRARHSDLVIHESRRLLAADIRDIDGIRVTCAERVVLDLASIWPSANFLETVVQAARRRRLVTYASMDATFARNARRGVRGVTALRTVLERWNPESRPTESDMETLLVQVLRDRRCPELVTQFEVRDRQGALVARVDVAIPEWRIVIEYDSKQEHSDEFQISRDNPRRNRILGAGFAPIVARHRDLLTGGDELYREIVETRRNWRHKVG